MSWYRDIQAVLEQEPETWLAYLYGQQLENLPHLTKRKPRVRGVFLRLAAFALFLLRHFKVKQPTKLRSHAEYVFFAGTVNQMSSLEGTADCLKQKGAQVVEIGDEKLLRTPERRSRYIPFSYTVLDILKCSLLLLRNGPRLYKQLKQKHPAAIMYYFNAFCSVYAHLVYFHRVLGRTNADFAVTANDHNPANRSFLAIAHQLGIKTVYMQHASVSPIFPALRVSYAFLDGQSAVDTYKECEPNQPATNRNVPIPQLFLTGQKKRLVRSVSKENEIIGVALNPLDQPDVAVEFVNSLVEEDLAVRVRWHPGQPIIDIQYYRAAFSGMSGVLISDPDIESVSDFLSQIRWLIAGNSSIHLEAALSGVIPIYYEHTPSDKPDYYGYARQGIANKAESASDIISLIQRRTDVELNVGAIKYYSATHLTEWEGREDELVAKVLHSIASGKAVSDDILSIKFTASTGSNAAS